MIEIDGSFGEGGGQILRSALSLSCCLGKPFRIFNIRAGRKNPGLQPQHLTCVRAAQLISGAETKGDSKGSSELSFIPGKVQAGHYRFDIGTAGSTSLVLQTILLPLCFAQGESDITITGGTHVPWSPPFHYLKYVFLPLLQRMGINVSLEIERWGFYPKGGGLIMASVKSVSSVTPINPVRKLAPFRDNSLTEPAIFFTPPKRRGFLSNGVNIEQRGRLQSLRGISVTGNLPVNIAERQRASALEVLRSHNLQADIEVFSPPCIGQGTFFFLLGEFENSIAGFSSLGERGKRAEDVGKEGALGFIRFYSGNGSIDRHLSDQIVPYLALSDRASLFTTQEITGHLLTNIWVIKKFLDVRIEVEGRKGEIGKITVNPQ